MGEATSGTSGAPADRASARGMATRFVSFAFAGADLLFEVNTAGTITFAMGASSGLTEKIDRELVGLAWTDIIHADDHAYVGALIRSLGIGSRCGPAVIRLAIPTPDGVPRPGVLSACRLPGDEERIACTLTRATAAVAATAASRKRDPESQLLEKDSFGEMAADVAAAAANLDQPVGLTMLDVPGLAALQKRLPAKAASEMIRSVGALLRAASVDGNSAGRVAEERFGLLQQDGAPTLPENIADLTRRLDPTGAGVVVSRTDVALSFDRMAPDDAMKAIRYVVNRFAEGPQGGAMPDTLTGAFESMVRDTVERMSRFAQTVRQDEFDVAFQPIVDLTDRGIHHFEVLARFKNGESPFETIRFAEQVGIIEQFDLGLCLRTVRQLESPDCDPRLSLAVNISGRSIENAMFVKCLMELIDHHRLVAKRMILEITESSELKDLAQVDRIVQDLRKRGSIVCLDDFGAGAASFQYLQALSIDYVKIDGAYVKRLGYSPRDDAMMKGIVSLCRDLHIKTIAEMIETNDQAAALRAIGVEYGQGYLFGKPGATAQLPPATVARIARRRGSQESWG